MADSNLVFIEGESIDIGEHGLTEYVYEENEPVENRDIPTFVRESGFGLTGSDIVDDWEVNRLDNYTGTLDNASLTTSVVAPTDSSRALSITASGQDDLNEIGSTNGLPTYPARGDVFQIWVRVDGDPSSEVGCGFAGQADVGELGETPDEYNVSLRPGDDEAVLRKVLKNEESIVKTTSVTINPDTWYRWVVDFDSAGDGVLRADLEDAGGNVIAEPPNLADTEWDGGGMSLAAPARKAYPNITAYWDEFIIL